MAGTTLKRWIPVLVLVVVASLVWWAQSRRPPEEYPMAYVVEGSAIVWNANAQVRQPVTTLHYGDRVTILQRSGDRAEVRTDVGVRGWIETTMLMDADLWQQATELLERVKAMPVQARGHTRTISNVRLTAGRDGARIFQFGRNEPVVVLERRASPIPLQDADSAPVSNAQSAPKLEDWLLILRMPPESAAAVAQAVPAVGGELAGFATQAGSAKPAVPVAGWVLARFIELDPPAPILDYFSAAGIRVVAWAVLNTVPGEDGPQPQYLVAGARGGEGQPCDFTILRVYTWGAARSRYETAYVENDICGRLPIRVSSTPAGEEFRFADSSRDGAERAYRMRQTSVRRIAGAAVGRAQQ